MTTTTATRRCRSPTMDVIDSAPYYAARIQAGDLGTKGGLMYNANGQVLRADGTVIAASTPPVTPRPR